MKTKTIVSLSLGLFILLVAGIFSGAYLHPGSYNLESNINLLGNNTITNKENKATDVKSNLTITNNQTSQGNINTGSSTSTPMPRPRMVTRAS